MKINIRLVRAHPMISEDNVFWEVLFEDKQKYCCAELRDSHLLHNKINPYPDEKETTPFETPTRLFFSGFGRHIDDLSEFDKAFLLNRLILLPIYRRVRYCMFCGKKFDVDIIRLMDLEEVYDTMRVKRLIETPLPTSDVVK